MYGWSGLDEWQNNDTTSITQIFQGWYDAEQAVVNPALRPARYEAMRKRNEMVISQDKLPLILLQYKFGYFDSLALEDGRLSSTNGMIADNNGSSPYFTKQVMIAALGKETVGAGRNYSVQLDTALTYNNTSEALLSATLYNVTTSTNYNLPVNGTAATIYFNDTGINIIRFTLTYASGSFVNYQKINVAGVSGVANRPSGPLCVPLHYLLESTIPFQGYDEQQATNSYADYHIYYHTVSPTATDCERTLLKPIIIMDGFDPQDVRSYNRIYKNDLRYNSIGDLILLGDDLRDKGYDVIILNFPKLGSKIRDENDNVVVDIPATVKVNGTTQTIDKRDRDGGADYIERNAYLLVKLIQDVNATLATNASTEKLVIVGPSMGGQIARYALAYMEKQESLGVPGMNHNTREFISFDSPNDGANIPVALQQNLYFFGYTGEKQDAKDKYEKQLHSPAARQLLIEQYQKLNGSEIFHSTFYNNIRNGGLSGSGGYPVNLRKVTLLNGNGTGIKTYSEGTKILQGVAKKFNIEVFNVEDYFMPSTGQTLTVAKTSVVVFKLRFPLIASIRRPTQAYTITNNNARGSMDAVQGSLYQSTSDVYNGFYEALDKFSLHPKQSWPTVLPNHCFIPSISALAFKNSSFDWNSTVTNRNLLCNNEIWFDNYFIPPVNEDHITLTADNVAWLSEEIDKGAANCPPICTFALNGAAQICPSQTFTYTFDVPVPSGYTIVWQSSIYYTVISQTNSSVTIQGASNGNVVLTGIITNPCGANVMIKKAITVGPLPLSLTGPEAFCNSANYYLNTASGGTLTWTISPSYQGFVESTETGGSIRLSQSQDYIIRNGNSGEITLTANYASDCENGTLTKTIFVGAHPPNFGVYAPYGNCAGQYFEAIATPTQSYGTVTYNWYLNGTLQSFHGYKLRSNFTSNSGNYIGVQIVTSTCGTSQENYQYFPCGTLRSTEQESFTVSPVPAKNSITVTGIDAFTFSAVQIVNKTGSVVKQWKLSPETTVTKLNIAGLSPDVYYLKVFDGKVWLGKSITVQ